MEEPQVPTNPYAAPNVASDVPPSTSGAAAHVTRRELWAWASYDWANSAYSTLSITFLMLYITKVVLPGDAGTYVWGYGIGISMLCAALMSPVIGAMADARANKRTWLALTALGGACAATLLGLVPHQQYHAVVALFFLASLGFELSLGVYNGFLPELADEHSINRVSSWGFACGYVGGGLALMVAVVFNYWGERHGLSGAERSQAGLLIMGLWWGLFSLPSIIWLRDRRPPRRERVGIVQAASHAFGEVSHTLRNIRKYRTLALFLLAFVVYNEGIQTVLNCAGMFAVKKFKMSDGDLVKLVLMIQFLALPGAIAIGKLADKWGQKPTLLTCLTIWIGLLLGSYSVETQGQFWVLGAVLAMVMGGTQALSRSMMGIMTPPKHAAEFFGFFNLSGKATSMLGPVVFTTVLARSHDPNLAILSLLIFFVIGTALLYPLNVARGRQAALEA